MIIGIDAGALSVSDERLKVGVWRLSFELIKTLSFIDISKSYRLYSFAPIPEETVRQFSSNVENVVLSPSTGYMKFRLPLELLFHPVDLFIGLSQALPWIPHSRNWGIFNSGNEKIVPTRTIGFVYDLAFIHMGREYGLSYPSLKNQTRDAARRSDKIVTISEFSKRDIMQVYGIPKDKIIVCYPGITHPSDVQQKVSLSSHAQRKPYILFVGALKKAKNIPAILYGFHAFLKQSKKAYDLLLVGGDYWKDREIDETIKHLGMEKLVHIHGHVSDEVLRTYYNEARAFITLGKWEGFCLPAVEAMSYGLPIVYADTGALPEVVGGAGIAVDPSDAIAVGKALNKALEDKKFRSFAYTQGRKRSHEFTWEQFGQQVMKVINATL